MNYVIIGASAAGIQAATELRLRDKESAVTVISDEKDYPYSRCLISRYVHGRLPESGLYFRTRHFFEDYNVRPLLDTRVTAIDRAKKTLATTAGPVPYDKLLIATGARPVALKECPPWMEGLYGFHTLSDARLLAAAAQKAKNAVVVGAGFAGLEAAYALARRGVKTTVIERCAHILPHQMDETAGGLIQRDFEELGVEFRFNDCLAKVNGGPAVRSAVTLNGAELPCEILVTAAGVLPNKELAEQAGLAAGRGIVVDEFLRTGDPDIYAAGDVIEVEDVVTGRRAPSATWFNAVLQGMYAGRNMAGGKYRYTGSVGIQNSVQFHYIPAISFGHTVSGGAYEELTWKGDRVYKKLVLKGDRIAGMIFVGDITRSGFYAALIREGADISRHRDKLLSPDFSYAYFTDRNFGQYDPYTFSGAAKPGA